MSHPRLLLGRLCRMWHEDRLTAFSFLVHPWWSIHQDSSLYDFQDTNRQGVNVLHGHSLFTLPPGTPSIPGTSERRFPHKIFPHQIFYGNPSLSSTSSWLTFGQDWKVFPETIVSFLMTHTSWITLLPKARTFGSRVIVRRCAGSSKKRHKFLWRNSYLATSVTVPGVEDDLKTRKRQTSGTSSFHTAQGRTLSSQMAKPKMKTVSECPDLRAVCEGNSYTRKRVPVGSGISQGDMRPEPPRKKDMCRGSDLYVTGRS